ncbi:MAG: DNA mismatch repair endonuclease MutL [Lachnospiraceae bacterium]|nr:DNA mismatch repair endonuclease MutL [Lachnospiraceae bacterium]
MEQIRLLTQDTIDKIAAGEVIERPASIVKELVENAIDAGANAVTVEIRDGGISFIRITDNGEGIPKEEIPIAFLRHATSKIKGVEDLLSIHSLGFRGEALSSIAAVCQVELITKTAGSLTGCRYLIEGGKEKGMEEIGAPEGSTFLVRNIFYNTPARKKFLKTAATEAGYISDLLEHLALSHPEISVKFISNGQTKLHTSGNNNLKDMIYSIYGRDIASNLVPIDTEQNGVRITGFIGKPVISRGNRNFENYFVNGRYVKSSVIAKAIEEGYKNFLMQHRYPFTVLRFAMDGSMLDINVHPTKMELRFADNAGIYQMVCELIKTALSHRELIPNVSLEENVKIQESKAAIPNKETEAADAQVLQKDVQTDQEKPALSEKYNELLEKFSRLPEKHTRPSYPEPFEKNRRKKLQEEKEAYGNTSAGEAAPPSEPSSRFQQMELFDEKLLSRANVPEHKLIGQVFDTYWIVQFRDHLYIIDQHAAHEKVMYERLTEGLKTKEFTTQRLSPPLILSLSLQEENLLKKYQHYFQQVGFEIEPFGGREYAVCGVPGNFFGIADRELFLEMLDGLSDTTGQPSAELLNEKLATMACKSAVKGNNRLSVSEANALIQELLSLENPYNCPHGRPTIISMSKYELEKKFKRIV